MLLHVCHFTSFVFVHALEGGEGCVSERVFKKALFLYVCNLRCLCEHARVLIDLCEGRSVLFLVLFYFLVFFCISYDMCEY